MAAGHIPDGPKKHGRTGPPSPDIGPETRLPAFTDCQGRDQGGGQQALTERASACAQAAAVKRRSDLCTGQQRRCAASDRRAACRTRTAAQERDAELGKAVCIGQSRDVHGHIVCNHKPAQGYPSQIAEGQAVFQFFSWIALRGDAEAGCTTVVACIGSDIPDTFDQLSQHQTSGGRRGVVGGHSVAGTSDGG